MRDHRQIEAALRRLGDPADAIQLQGFFKTGPGEYGEGDRFLGIRVPVLRKCVRQYRNDAGPADALALLQSQWHEVRLFALLLLVAGYEAGTAQDRVAIYRAYLDNTARINNWDLVDLSAPNLVGAHLLDRSRNPLRRLARSRNLWERRIAIVATHRFIRQNDFADTVAISELLLHDRHDLIHKAVGWMLREVGKRDVMTERAFLDRHHHEMPRTMLRYAIERFPEPERLSYLRGKRSSQALFPGR